MMVSCSLRKAKSYVSDHIEAKKHVKKIREVLL